MKVSRPPSQLQLSRLKPGRVNRSSSKLILLQFSQRRICVCVFWVLYRKDMGWGWIRRNSGEQNDVAKVCTGKSKRTPPPPPPPGSIRGVDGRIFFWLSARHFPTLESHTINPPPLAPLVLNRSINRFYSFNDRYFILIFT